MIKNQTYNSFGTIDCEYQHPTFGWIPFTASPDDSEVLGRDIYARVIAGEFGEIAPYVEPEPLPAVIPSIVTMRQARLALLQQGLLSEVQLVIQALPSPQKEAAEIEWEYALDVNRQSPLVQSLAASLELSEDDLDLLFTLASNL